MIAETFEFLVISFISSAVLIVMSKIILQNLIRRPADYYLADEIRQEELMLNSAGLSITDEMETNPEGEITDEHISVTPQISVEDAVDMHLIKRERIPDRFKNEDVKSGPGSENSKSGKNAKNGRKRQSGDSDAVLSKDADKKKHDTLNDEDLLAEIYELREIIMGSSQAASGSSQKKKDAASDKAKKSRKSGADRKGSDRKSSDRKVSGKTGRHPSMKMRKDELLAAAAAAGIDVPEKASKREILDLINAVNGRQDKKPVKAESKGRGNNQKNQNKAKEPDKKKGAEGSKNPEAKKNTERSKDTKAKKNTEGSKDTKAKNNTEGSKNAREPKKRKSGGEQGTKRKGGAAKTRSRNNNKSRSKKRDGSDQKPEQKQDKKQGNKQKQKQDQNQEK